MASTDQVRQWYHQGVVLNHSQRGSSGYTPRCNHAHPTVAFPREGGGFFNEPVHPATVEAWTAYIATMVHHGETMPGSGGVNQCRNIGDTDWPSLHAYLCAVDLPPNSRKSSAFIAAVEKIRTNSGAQVFRNLAGDRMHDQIDCSPAALATGINWSTVPGSHSPAPQPQPQPAPEEDDMWSDLNIDEGLVRHASAQGWYKKPDGSPDLSAGTVNYFLQNLAELQKAEQSAVRADFRKDWLNWRRAVVNGVFRTRNGVDGRDGRNGKDGADGGGGVSEARVRQLIESTGHNVP